MAQMKTATAAASNKSTANKMSTNKKNKKKTMKKSTDNTVFIRFTPASSEVNRWHLEEFFSNIGPIKKCSVISSNKDKSVASTVGGKNSLGYGFVKFVALQDAQQAARDCNNASLTVNDKEFKLKVELASASNAAGGSSAAAPPKKEQKQPSNNDKASKEEAPAAESTTNDDGTSDDFELLAKRKRTCRVIVRNLSFYATERDIQSTLEKEFGAVTELHLPRVNPKLHRGFCFATFANVLHAQQATAKRDKPLLIKKRPVAIDFCMAKSHHQQQQLRAKKEKEEEANDDDGDEDMEDASGDDDESNDSDDSSDSDDDSDDDDDDDDGSDDETEPAKREKKVAPVVDEGVTTQRTLFLRNLPFDATRNDIFQLMRKYGHIDSIHPVMDRSTGVFKGTAFLAYSKPDAAAKALLAASSGGQHYGDDSKFMSQRRQQDSNDGEGIMMRGRRLLLDLAVDKGTASTLTMEKTQDGSNNKTSGRDRRNLYLKNEGYINTTAHAGMDAAAAAANAKNDPSAWENLPESDQLKRQRALTDKTTKLRSPLFFINSNRLSIRNLSKHIDEAGLKRLLVTATKRGMENLVSVDDQVAHWRSTGDMSARDIMNKLNEAKGSKDESGKEDTSSILPTFDEQNIRKYMPSVFIDRDFALAAPVAAVSTPPGTAPPTAEPAPKKNKDKAPSRGFGFVDFTHHIHALACLRELNNNTAYSTEYVIGGKRAMELKKSKMARTAKNAKKKSRKGEEAPASGEFTSADGRSLVPRLIVEFTVENKAKAQQQAANRTKQAANVEKQRLDQIARKELKKKNKDEKKKSRGALQREKKRKRREEGLDDDGKKKKNKKVVESSDDESEPEPEKKAKKAKPPKKQKVDKEEQSFEKLVRSYTNTFQSAAEASEKAAEGSKDKRAKVAEKRWFE